MIGLGRRTGFRCQGSRFIQSRDARKRKPQKVLWAGGPHREPLDLLSTTDSKLRQWPPEQPALLLVCQDCGRLGQDAGPSSHRLQGTQDTDIPPCQKNNQQRRERWISSYKGSVLTQKGSVGRCSCKESPFNRAADGLTRRACQIQTPAQGAPEA